MSQRGPKRASAVPASAAAVATLPRESRRNCEMFRCEKDPTQTWSWRLRSSMRFHSGPAVPGA